MAWGCAAWVDLEAVEPGSVSYGLSAGPGERWAVVRNRRFGSCRSIGAWCDEFQSTLFEQVMQAWSASKRGVDRLELTMAARSVGVGWSDPVAMDRHGWPWPCLYSRVEMLHIDFDGFSPEGQFVAERVDGIA